jgi:outer membrane protein
MKNFSIALNAILLVLVIILFVMVNNLKKSMGQDGSNLGSGTMVGKNKPLRVAHINLDTINEDYLVIKDFKKEVEAKEGEIQEEYSTKGKKLQDEYQAYMQRKQSGNISELDAEKEEQNLQAKKNELDGLQQQRDDIMKDAQDRTLELQKKVQNYVTNYNKKAQFDYILYNVNVGGLVVYANDSLDITKPILTGLNQMYKDSVQKASSGADAKH